MTFDWEIRVTGMELFLRKPVTVEANLHSFLTSLLDGTEFCPQERAPLPFEKAAGWDSEPVWTLLEKCLFFFAGNRTAILGIVTTGHFICVIL